jgi:signal transduction histidine kinase
LDKPSVADQEYLARLLSLATHEFRTPVAVAIGYIGFLRNERFSTLNEQQREWMDRVLNSCSRINELVDEMSAFSKLAADTLQLASHDIELNALVTELASGMHEGDDRGVRVDVTTSETPLSVRGDRPRLFQSLRGLMHAAVRERGMPGVIKAECSTARDSDGMWAVVAIGQESLIESLRQRRNECPFKDEWKGGTGLVVPFARQIIEAHGGALWSTRNDTSNAASAIRLPLRT